jgi:alpha-maltose-1-phosphate synthase
VLNVDGSTDVLGLVEGDPRSALSGVGHHLLDALGRRVSLAGTVDYGAHGAQRLALAAATFRRSRAIWRGRFHTSLLAHRVLSRNLRRRLMQFDGRYRVALQIHGWVSGQPTPYTLFVDQTRLMAEHGWPEWMPLNSRERDQILALEREMYARAAHVFAMGLPGRDSLVSDYGVAAERVTVVGGGLRFDALPSPAPLAADPRILFVGRDFARKGGPVLLRAFERVRDETPEATLHLVGTTAEPSQPGVISHGPISDPHELVRLYGRARVFTLPSLYEPYGLVLIEAMAHGLPCVGSSVQSIPEILDQGRAGILVPPDDPDALAEVLLKLLRDDGLAGDLGRAGREFVEANLTWDHVAERIAPILTHLAEGRRNGS